MVKIAAFISIPKCATQTIIEMCKLGPNRALDTEDSPYYIIHENHHRLSVIEKRHDLSDKFVFTFVRHPYERVRSWFYYFRKQSNSSEYTRFTLNEWIENGCKTHLKKQHPNHWYTEWYKEGINPLFQYYFVAGNKKVDFIGKMENFEEDCKSLIKRLNQLFEENNISQRLTYTPIKKNTTSNIVKDEITPANRERIYEMFKQDFDYFGYAK